MRKTQERVATHQLLSSTQLVTPKVQFARLTDANQTNWMQLVLWACNRNSLCFKLKTLLFCSDKVTMNGYSVKTPVITRVKGRRYKWRGLGTVTRVTPVTAWQLLKLKELRTNRTGHFLRRHWGFGWAQVIQFYCLSSPQTGTKPMAIPLCSVGLLQVKTSC